MPETPPATAPLAPGESAQAAASRSARQRWASRGGAYDAAVKSAKLVLPIIAGLLLAVLVIAPLLKKNEVSFVLAKDSVEQAPERMKLEEAVYRGQDDKGRNFALTAGSALQQNSADAHVNMQDLTAQIDLSQGPASLVAGRGVYDMKGQVVDIPGDLSFKSADGYNLLTHDVAVDLMSQTLKSAGRVSGETPLGTFNGGYLTGDLDAQTVALKGGVNGTVSVGNYSAETMEVDNKAGTVVLRGKAKLHIKQGAFSR